MQHPYPYQPIDRHIVLNQNDADLFPIRIDLFDLLKRTYRQYNLPEPDDFPPFEEICNYGLPPDDQVFEREQIPESLTRLERQIRNDLKKVKRITAIKMELSAIDLFWEAIEENPEKYAAEIEWIKQMWQYRLLGKFIFIRGKVYYLPGFFWFFLNFYIMDDVRPEFRYWDMMLATGWKFAQLDTTTFKDIDPATRKPIPNEQGEYEMIDLGRRVCCGVNDPKARRVGDTSRAQCFGMEESTRLPEYHFMTQGRDEAHAKKVFQQQFMRPFEKIPIFFRPVWDSSLGVKPKEHILFDGDTSDFGLHTRVTHAQSASAESYNGDKGNFYHNDESGNNENEQIDKSHGIVKFCMSLGDRIIGFSVYTTTVEAVSAGSAGENYMNLCLDSQYEIRDDNGRTRSWMYNTFISADLRMEGFIDKYGFPVSDTPTPEQARFIGKEYGARKFIENTVKELSRKKDWENLSLFQRQYPLRFRDCFSPPGRNQFFPVEIVRNRIQHITFTDRTQLPERGDFMWSSGFGSDVVWVKNDSGRWFKSRDFAPHETNQRMQVGGMWYPKDRLSFVHSADVFGSDKPSGRASLGGSSTRWLHDPVLDPMTKDIRFWQSKRLIISYKYRPDTVDEFCEDVLKQNIYCGGLQYPERNKSDVIHYYRRNGYEGFLLYDIDRVTGKPRLEPGWYCKDEIKVRIFNLVRDELTMNAGRCRHPDWLEECCDIRSPQAMTDYDLFTSVAGCLLAEMNPYYSILRSTQKLKVNTERWIPEETY